MKHLKLFAALCCAAVLPFGLHAAEVPAVIALSSDGVEMRYELSSVQRIVFDAGGMTLQRTAEAGDVSGVRCVFFGTMEQTPTSVAPAGESAVFVYPNPVAHTLLVDGAAAGAPLVVYDLHGRALLRTSEPQVDVSALAEGCYLLKVGDKVVKFVKK